MNALEFTAKIENGVIHLHLPKEYNQYDDVLARIIVLLDEPQATKSQADQLREVFQKMKGKKMFRSIENPRLWQKKLRDEWE